MKWREMNSRQKAQRFAELAAARLAEKHDGALEARRDEAARRRAEREAYWLEQERPGLNGRRGKPLSQMPA